MSGNGFSNPIDTGTEDWDLDEELRRKDVVFDVGVRDINGVGCEDRNGVNLEKGSNLGDFQVGVESVSKQGVAGIGVRTGFDC